MKETYVIPEIKREDIVKMVKRFEKKAAAYGQTLVVEYGEPYAEEIAVFDRESDYNGLSVNVKVGTMLVEVFDVTIESEIICKEGYTVVAKIEHLEGGNVVYNLVDEERPDWSVLKPRCEHCGGNHGQKVTFIVRAEDGSEKQVGRTCLKDYCGIDPQRIGWQNQLNDLFLEEEVGNYDFTAHPEAIAQSTIKALALAIRLQRKFGYVSSSEPGSNKEKLIELCNKNVWPTDEEEAEAEKIAAAVKGFDVDEAVKYLLDNVRSLLYSGYCKYDHFGYIAYAPLAYERYLEAKERENEREAVKNAERKASEHVGEVGQRITIDVASMELLTSWETQWGYTYLYKIVDVSGNVMVWFASRGVKTDGAKQVKATVKDHSERDGVKQTVLTRCKVVVA